MIRPGGPVESHGSKRLNLRLPDTNRTSLSPLEGRATIVLRREFVRVVRDHLIRPGVSAARMHETLDLDP